MDEQVGSTLPAQLVERDAALAAVRHALAQARNGDGSGVLLQGAAGLGKTAILDRAAALATERGLRVLRAHGAESERDFPFGVVLQLFEQAVAGRQEELLTGSAALARPVFDGTALAGAAGPAFSAVHGLYWLTVALAQEHPLVLCVDDLHVVDDVSLGYLLYLLRRIDELPVAVIAATRPVEFRERPALGELVTHPADTVVDLEPLSKAGVASVVRDSFDPQADESFCTACAELSGGNPFFLKETIASLRAEQIPATPDGAERVRSLEPDAVGRAVLLRLSRLPEEAHELARAVAVLDDNAPLTLAAGVAGLGALAAARAAEALAREWIFVPSDPLKFVHALVRSAVLGDMSETARGELHLKAAELLAEQGAPAERVAAHLLHAPPQGDERHLALLAEAAAHAAAAGMMGSAASLLERALRESPPPGRRRAELLAALARTEMGSDPAAAQEHISTARAEHPDPRASAELQFELGRALYVQGRHREACDAFLAGVDMLDPDDPLAHELRAWFVSGSLFDEDLWPLREQFLRELTVQTPADPTPAERAVLAQLAVQRIIEGEPLSAVREQAQAAWGDGALLRAETVDGYSWTHVTAVFLWGGDFPAARDVAQLAMEDARRRGSVMGFAAASYIRGSSFLWEGRLLDAIADFEQALDAHHRYGWSMFIGAARTVYADALIERDDLGAAEQVVGEIEDAFERSAEGALLHCGRGRLRVAQGRFEEAIADLERAREVGASTGMSLPQLLPWWPPLALARSALGEREAALELLAEIEPILERAELPGRLGQLLTVRAGLLPRDAQLTTLEDAVTRLENSPARLELARALVAQGAALRRAGQRREALDSLRRGLELAHQLGGLAVERLAREELRVAGARPRRAAQTGIEGLTPSELRVSRMAADGLTNREIAESLFVTPKTVEYHLRNAFLKLNVSSRRELVPLLTQAS